jgi:hypothetical protein
MLKKSQLTKVQQDGEADKTNALKFDRLITRRTDAGAGDSARVSSECGAPDETSQTRTSLTMLISTTRALSIKDFETKCPRLYNNQPLFIVDN